VFVLIIWVLITYNLAETAGLDPATGRQAISLLNVLIKAIVDIIVSVFVKLAIISDSDGSMTIITIWLLMSYSSCHGRSSKCYCINIQQYSYILLQGYPTVST
jgi:hypothetical protein